ncbi:unnamed protein product [Peniophora sp. CBMAI 1063]|nr:unnamed protein product [Peniophora sp. CBMAI 1063]
MHSAGPDKSMFVQSSGPRRAASGRERHVLLRHWSIDLRARRENEQCSAPRGQIEYIGGKCDVMGALVSRLVTFALRARCGVYDSSASIAGGVSDAVTSQFLQ